MIEIIEKSICVPLVKNLAEISYKILWYEMYFIVYTISSPPYHQRGTPISFVTSRAEFPLVFPILFLRDFPLFIASMKIVKTRS